MWKFNPKHNSWEQESQSDLKVCNCDVCRSAIQQALGWNFNKVFPEKENNGRSS